MPKENHFDYIICGGGMAGLSLAYNLINSTLHSKKILIIEPTDKNTNDRTWSFWENKKGTFDDILYRRWKTLAFADETGTEQILDIGNYEYKMIRGIDFYNFTIPKIKNHPSVTWLKESVLSIDENKNCGLVKTTNNSFSGDYIFESIYKPNLKIEKYHNLLQHFMGWVIETKTSSFNPEIPMMMNFGIEQHNDCRFVYVMPFSKTQAIVEYTVFSEAILTEEEYQNELKEYVENHLKITDYQIEEVEFGVIPMSDEPMKQQIGQRLIRIGTAGGATNPATGYTFQGVQKNIKLLIGALEKTNNPHIKTSFLDKRFNLYQSVLLNVLKKKRIPAASVFSRLYEKNPAWKIFKFLDNETSFLEEIAIMWSTKKPKFIAAVFDVLKR